MNLITPLPCSKHFNGLQGYDDLALSAFPSPIPLTIPPCPLHSNHPGSLTAWTKAELHPTSGPLFAHVVLQPKSSYTRSPHVTSRRLLLKHISLSLLGPPLDPRALSSPSCSSLCSVLIVFIVPGAFISLLSSLSPSHENLGVFLNWCKFYTKWNEQLLNVQPNAFW